MSDKRNGIGRSGEILVVILWGVPIVALILYFVWGVLRGLI